MQPRVGIASAAAAPIANGLGRVGAVMDDQGGSTGMMISSEEAAELIPLEQYVSLGHPGLEMIGTIRPELESRDVAEWRPSSSEMETGGPTFVTGENDVIEVTRALDHRIPLPIGHLLSISGQANERMMQHCKANRKRFDLACAKEQKTKAPPWEEKADVAPDPTRVGLIQKDDHFLRIKPIPWKSAECDIEVWGMSYSAIIDSGAAVLAISLRAVERAGRKNDLIMLTEKDQLVSADEEKIKTVGLRPGCRRVLTQELTVPIAQVADHLDVSIVSQVDPRLVPHVTSRTLSPYLQWSACVEGFPSRIPPSQLDYLDPRDIVDPAFYRPPYEDEVEEIIREELAEESSEEEEENLNEDEGEPAQQQEGDEDELLQTESEEEAEEEDSKQGSGDDNDEQQANEDPQLEIAPVADLPISNDPTLDPEPPQPDDGHVAQMGCSRGGSVLSGFWEFVDSLWAWAYTLRGF
ncbi:hypothetical protein CBR_g49279 [Chara braunii]|uniref:Uncharacterized protein n=1 Tax=Chara braunii TaxID=69332 RepID=A0A388M4I3_CHABU|nr:hypothetical protein CBR_g49279 [Chara braunii]|eukprot:GBG89488.1 hypothetical protein CBR_g49279 [Chara braunii]